MTNIAKQPDIDLKAYITHRTSKEIRFKFPRSLQPSIISFALKARGNPYIRSAEQLPFSNEFIIYLNSFPIESDLNLLNL